MFLFNFCESLTVTVPFFEVFTISEFTFFLLLSIIFLFIVILTFVLLVPVDIFIFFEPFLATTLNLENVLPVTVYSSVSSLYCSFTHVIILSIYLLRSFIKAIIHL